MLSHIAQAIKTSMDKHLKRRFISPPAGNLHCPFVPGAALWPRHEEDEDRVGPAIGGRKRNGGRAKERGERQVSGGGQ